MTTDDVPYMPIDFSPIAMADQTSNEEVWIFEGEDYFPEPMTMAELANCHDCRWLTTALGEFYMVHDHLWGQACQVSPRAIPRFLCIGCLEERLGRMLTPEDFTDCLLNDPDKPQGASSRLRKRLTGKAT